MRTKERAWQRLMGLHSGVDFSEHVESMRLLTSRGVQIKCDAIVSTSIDAWPAMSPNTSRERTR
jgi:hypothetical protein